MSDLVMVEDSGHVRYLRLNRPERLNALSSGVFDALDAELDRVESDRQVRVLVIGGTGERAFCAGADLDELDGLSVPQAAALLGRGQATFVRLERLGTPVIAAVHGLALGGGFELALATSFILASEEARFGLPESGLGLIPGYGGTQRLPRRVGRQVALAVMLSGAPLDGRRAYELGLLAEPPVPVAQLAERTETVAQVVASKGPGAVRLILEATRSSGSLTEGLERETDLAARATASAEAAEGIGAFRERRPPVFP